MVRTKIALAAAAASVASFGPDVTIAPAQAKANPAIEQCREILPNLPESNLGECLSWITVAKNEAGGEVAHHCDALQENDPFVFELMFVSKSECIQAFGLRGHFKGN